MAKSMLQIDNSLINVENISFITFNVINNEVVIMDDSSTTPPVATISFFANGGTYEVKFDDLDKAKAVFEKISALTSAQVIDAKGDLK